MKTLLIHDGISDSAVQPCLAHRGHSLILAATVEEARAHCERHDFPLIVLVLAKVAPQIEFCAWYRRRLGPRNRAFLLGSISLQSPGDWLVLAEAGADDFLIRPSSSGLVAARLVAVEQQIRQRQEAEQVTAASNTRAQQQVAVAALGQASAVEDFSTLATLACRFIVDALDVSHCALLLRTEDGSLRFLAGFGWREGFVEHSSPVPPVDTMTGRALAGEDVLVSDLPQDERFTGSDFVREHSLVSGISVGLPGKERVLGVLGAYTVHPRKFVDDELRFLEGLANVLGATLVRERNQAEIQKHQSQIQHLQRLESVGQLAAGLAHDYNNVLTVIHGHVTLALGEPGLPNGVIGSLKTVMEAVERAAGLTRQMLSFSRKQSMTLQSVDLNAAVASMAKLLDRVLGSRVRVKIESGTGLPPVYADPGMLDQVLMNLAVNARDAMPAGGTLSIATTLHRLSPDSPKHHAEARPGDFVCLSVSDTGCGMDEATLRRIFDPFFTTKEPGKGTGLGLSTVFGIVKQHQGWIEVESQPGRGTQFRIMLPASDAPMPEAPAEVLAPPPEKGKETVLLVEDEASLRELARLLLEDLGYDVIEAASGQEALESWKQHEPAVSVLLTDFILPDGLTGFELAERLHREKPSLRVVLTSGYSAEEVSQHRGFQFVQKPYRSETLGRALRGAGRTAASLAHSGSR